MDLFHVILWGISTVSWKQKQNSPERLICDWYWIRDTMRSYQTLNHTSFAGCEVPPIVTKVRMEAMQDTLVFLDV